MNEPICSDCREPLRSGWERRNKRCGQCQRQNERLEKRLAQERAGFDPELGERIPSARGMGSKL